ncbi:MAG: RHS repeat-associated core domain-containing protein [Planctomyces sp.]
MAQENGWPRVVFWYDIYGKHLAHATDGTASSAGAVTICSVTFTGRVFSCESQELHFRTRTYSPRLGRFIGRDLAGSIDGNNLYSAYFSVRGTDPFGLFFNGKTEDHHWFMKYWGSTHGQDLFNERCQQFKDVRSK